MRRKTSETEPSHADDLAVVAAMALLEVGWQLQNIATALQRDGGWLESEIIKAMAAEQRGSLH